MAQILPLFPLAVGVPDLPVSFGHVLNLWIIRPLHLFFDLEPRIVMKLYRFADRIELPDLLCL